MAPKVAIIGAGPAGLTLGRILSESPIQIDFTVFEQDASANARNLKGGTLDLHSDTGIAALDAAGLRDEFNKVARYEGQALIIGDKHGNHLLEDEGDAEGPDSPGARPEIDRKTLQQLLLDGAKFDIRWGSHLKSVSPEGLLLFDHGTEGPFDLIVGADGAWSKIRPILTDIRPAYAGISGFEFHISNPTKEYPQVSEMVGRGSYFAYSDGRSINAQRLSDDSILLHTWGRNPETYGKDLLAECGGDIAQVKAKLLDEFSAWLPQMLEWITVSDPDHIRPWPLYELPVGHTWQHKKGYTLIGDAAHLMTPFAGEGVNTAMKDALELANGIIESAKSGNELDDAVKSYEADMFPRAKQVTGETMENKIVMFRDDAPKGFVERLSQMMSGGDIPPEMMARMKQVAETGGEGIPAEMKEKLKQMLASEGNN